MASTTGSELSAEDFARRYGTGPDVTPRMRELFITYGRTYRWFVVFTVMAGSFSTLLASTIINVAIPSVMGAYGMPYDDAQWLSAGFLAASTVTMALSAWALQSFGMKTVYTFGMTGFMVGSIIGGLAPTAEMLIFSRIVQGAATGLIGPMGMLILFQVFPLNRRGRAMGLFGVGTVLAPALGPSLGGTLIDSLSWHYVFYSALPFCLASIPMALVFLPNREESGPWPTFDWIGLFLMLIFVPCFMLGLSDGQSEGWSSTVILSYFIAAGIAATAFLIWEWYYPNPMLDLRVFLNRGFATAIIVTAVMGAGLYGSTYMVPLFLQTIQGQTATSAGMLMLPAGLAMAFLFLIGGELSDRVPSNVMIISGLLVFAAFAWLMAGADANTPYGTLLWWAILSRVGLGLIFPTLSRAAMITMPFHLLPQAAGAMNFLRQLGSAFGVTVVAIVLEQRRALYLDAFTIPQTDMGGASGQVMIGISRLMAEAGVPQLLQLPTSFMYLMRIIDAQAGMMAFRDGFLVVAVIFLITIIPAWFMDRTRPGQADPRSLA